MKKRTRKNFKKGGSSSNKSSFSSSSIDAFQNWKTDHPEIMSEYNDLQRTTGSLSIGVVGTMLTAALFGFVIYNKFK